MYNFEQTLFNALLPVFQRALESAANQPAPADFDVASPVADDTAPSALPRAA